MSHRQPGVPGVRIPDGPHICVGSPTVYRVRRRRGLLALTLALAAMAALAGTLKLEGATQGNSSAERLFGGAGGNPSGHGLVLGLSRAADASRASPLGWPLQGQAALVLGDGRPAVSPHQQAAPIASLAKVMTAYLTLERYPLSAAGQGFTVTVTVADAQLAAQDVSDGQSGVAVRPGERLTERQMLEALLIPSGNNIAQMLASEVAGGEQQFVARMNSTARALGMRQTVYTDPSGFDPRTVSTAADQLRVFRRALRWAAFRQIVSMASVTLPVAGTLRNFNPLIGDAYAGKTGSDSAAGGCLAFYTRVLIAGRGVTAVGVVMGQGEGGDTGEILSAAGQAAQQLVASAGGDGGGQVVAPVTGDQGGQTGSATGPASPPAGVPSLS